jgi:D-proline reductase (dithiol) PrdB
MSLLRRAADRLFSHLSLQGRLLGRAHDALNQRYGHYAIPDLRPHLGPTPWAPLRRPLTEAMVGLFTTAGVHLRSQPGFTVAPDPSYRVIPAATPDDDLMITHEHYNHQDADRDVGMVFPLALLRALEGKLIGRLAPEQYGMMGYLGVENQWKKLHRAVRELAGHLRGSGLDVAVLTPG